MCSSSDIQVRVYCIDLPPENWTIFNESSIG